MQNSFYVLVKPFVNHTGKHLLGMYQLNFACSQHIKWRCTIYEQSWDDTLCWRI